MLFALLEMIRGQSHGLMPPQPEEFALLRAPDLLEFFRERSAPQGPLSEACRATTS